VDFGCLAYLGVYVGLHSFVCSFFGTGDAVCVGLEWVWCDFSLGVFDVFGFEEGGDGDCGWVGLVVFEEVVGEGCVV